MRLKKGVFSTILLSSLFIGCGGGDGQSVDIHDIEISKIFPEEPKVALDGELKLIPVVSSAYSQEIKTPSLNEQMNISWSSSNPNIATISPSGVIKGVRKGVVTITAKVDYNLTDDSGELIYSDIDSYFSVVEVVNTVGAISEISLSPTRVTLDKVGGKRVFDITAVDSSGVLSSIGQGVIDFNISNTLENADKILKQPTQIVDGTNIVELESSEDRTGYSFITPIYTDSYDGNITVTGNPLVVQVIDVPKATPDERESANLDAGKFLDLQVDTKDNGKKELHIVHYDGVDSTLKYSYFNGTWYTQDINPTQTGLNNGINAKIGISPFKTTEGRAIITALEGERVKLWYQNSANNWLSSDVSLKDINNTFYTFNSMEDKFLDMVVDRVNQKLYIAYFSPIDSRVFIKGAKMDSSSDFDFSNEVYSIDTDNSKLQSLSLALHQDGNFSLAYSTYDSNSSDLDSKGLFYYSFGKANLSSNCTPIGVKYRCSEKIAGTNGQEKDVVLKFERDEETPTILYLTSKDDLIFTQRTEVATGYSWSFSNISFDENLENISDIDFLFDCHDSPRVVFNSNGKIRYARRDIDTLNNPLNPNRWIVETPEDSEGFGEYSAIDLDSENRAHIVYRSEEDEWFKYWAEPIFFDYRLFNQNCKYRIGQQ